MTTQVLCRPHRSQHGMTERDKTGRLAAPPTMSDDNKITREAFVSLGLAATVCGFVGAAGSWIGTTMMGHQFDLRLQSIEAEVRVLAGKVEVAGTDRWRSRDMRIWTRALGDLNPDLRVPSTGDE